MLYVLMFTHSFSSQNQEEFKIGKFHRAELSLRYFIISMVSSFILLLGTTFIYLAFGSMDFGFIGLYFRVGIEGIELFAGYLHFWGLLFWLLGIVSKLGLAPFHL